MVIKDIIYIMVVVLFTVACWLQVELVPRGVKLLPLGLSTWGLLLLVGSRWNMFHVEIDCFMPRNNISSTAYGHDGDSSLRGLSGSPEGLQCTRLGKVHIPSCRVRGRY